MWTMMKDLCGIEGFSSVPTGREVVGMDVPRIEIRGY